MTLSEIIIVCSSVLSAAGLVAAVIKCVSVVRQNNAIRESLYRRLALQEQIAKQQDEEMGQLLRRVSTVKREVSAIVSEKKPMEIEVQDKKAHSSHAVINHATAAKRSPGPTTSTNDGHIIEIQEALGNLPMASRNNASSVKDEQERVRLKAEQVLEEELMLLDQGSEMLERETDRPKMSS